MPGVDEAIFPDFMQNKLDNIINSGSLRSDETVRADLANQYFSYDEDERREAIEWMINQVGTQSSNYKIALILIADRADKARQDGEFDELMPDPMDTQWVRTLNNKSGGDMTKKAAASLVRHEPDLTNFSIRDDGTLDYDLLSVFLYQNDHKHVQRWVDEGGGFRAYELRRAARGALFGTESLEIALDHRPCLSEQLYKVLRSYLSRSTTEGEPSVERDDRAVCELLEDAGLPHIDDERVEDLPGAPRSVTGSILSIIDSEDGHRKDRITALRRALRTVIDKRVPISEPGAEYLYSIADEQTFEREPELVELTFEALLRQGHLPERSRLQELLNSQYADVIEDHTRSRKLKAARTGSS